MLKKANIRIWLIADSRCLQIHAEIQQVLLNFSFLSVATISVSFRLKYRRTFMEAT
jgi:hypothetical protein